MLHPRTRSRQSNHVRETFPKNDGRLLTIVPMLGVL